MVAMFVVRVRVRTAARRSMARAAGRGFASPPETAREAGADPAPGSVGRCARRSVGGS
jgi:hypothetical protein